MDAMGTNCQNSDRDPKFLFDQLSTARKEINNLRQQLKSLRYIHEKDVDRIKRLLSLCTGGVSIFSSNPEISREVEPSTSQDSDDVLKFKPIGVISTWFPNKRGTPRQPGICEKAPGKVTLFNSVLNNPEHALEGLHEFSHMWILFHFHKNDSTHIRAKVAPPRLNGVKTGVFSTRSPHRPCPIGMSLVKIVKIENNSIYFEGVDMVDQTPVLDIKPYIPQYDNPLHIEKLHTRLSVELEMVANGSEIQIPETLSLRDRTRENITNDRFNPSLEVDSSSLPQESLQAEDLDSSDISRDEEIAFRLQAEEFQDNYYPDFENEAPDSIMQYLRPRQEIPSGNGVAIRNTENTASTRNSENGTLTRNTENTSSSRNSENATLARSSEEEVAESSERIRNVNLDNGVEDNRRTEDRAWRNSRLLEGADGPSTVCGTDLDLIRRRALNSRLDNNSPVRMGVREAPDGEEGFESQSLTPSQTVPNIHNATRNFGNPAGAGEAALRTGAESRITPSVRNEAISTEIRVPDWISRPQTSTLSVVFSERALAHLSEILVDKAEEEKLAIENVLREDPRSVYLRQRWGNQFYTFLIHDLHITCRFDDSRKIVTVFQVRHAGRTCECGEPEWQCLGHSPLT